MTQALAFGVSSAFFLLALWHFQMALMPSSAQNAAVPSVDGKPLFVPSAKATWAVGVMLFLFAMLVAATGDVLSLGVPRPLLAGLSLALALGLLARAVGEFKHVGFFKRNRTGRFATLDTYVYSPLCVLLSAGVATVAFS